MTDNEHDVPPPTPAVSQDVIDRLAQATVHDPSGEKIGSVGLVYLDDKTGEPSWVSVKMGLFGTRETLVPLDDADLSGSDITVPFTKDVVKDAPRVDADNHISRGEEGELHEYYRRHGWSGGARDDSPAQDPEQQPGAGHDSSADPSPESPVGRHSAGSYESSDDHAASESSTESGTDSSTDLGPDSTADHTTESGQSAQHSGHSDHSEQWNDTSQAAAAGAVGIGAAGAAYAAGHHADQTDHEHGTHQDTPVFDSAAAQNSSSAQSLEASDPSSDPSSEFSHDAGVHDAGVHQDALDQQAVHESAVTDAADPGSAQRFGEGEGSPITGVDAAVESDTESTPAWYESTDAQGTGPQHSGTDTHSSEGSARFESADAVTSDAEPVGGHDHHGHDVDAARPADDGLGDGAEHGSADSNSDKQSWSSVDAVEVADGPSGRRISEYHEVRDGGYGVGSAAPIEDNAQPLGHPVRAWWDTMSFRNEPELEGEREPDVWFFDEQAAYNAGYHPAD